MTSDAGDITIERVVDPSTADRDAIIAIEAGSFSNPWNADTFARMLAVEVGRVYVARAADGAIAAFCACWLIRDELHINTIAVAGHLRRRGIATRLIRAVLDATGAIRATLEVRRSNEAAIRLYERLGFQVTAVRQRYYENPEEDGLILWLNS